MLDLAGHFSRFIRAEPERIHFAAHSHHYWPDPTFAAQQRCWEDAALHADEKWGPIFGEVIPSVQAGIARAESPDPSTIAVAPNTHEFLRRLLSALPLGCPGRILTTDGEFHSLTRQVAPRGGQARRGRARPGRALRQLSGTAGRACRRGGHDLVYVESGVLQFRRDGGGPRTTRRCRRDPDTLIAVDGYHGYMAVPTDLSAVAHRIFYLAGGYKYAMAGESACSPLPARLCAPSSRHRMVRGLRSLDGLQGAWPTARTGRASWAPPSIRQVSIGRARSSSGCGSRPHHAGGDHAHVLELQRLFLEAVDAGGFEVFAAPPPGADRGSPPRPLSHVRDRDGRRPARRTPREAHRHRRARRPHPLRLRLLSRPADIDRAVERLKDKPSPDGRASVAPVQGMAR